MRSPFVSVLVLALATAHAQSPPDASPSPSAISDFDALVADFTTARAGFIESLRVAPDDDARKALVADAEKNPSASFRKRFQAAADERRGKGDAIHYLEWLIRTAPEVPDVDVQPTIERLLSDHVASPELLSFVERTLPMLRMIADEETFDRVADAITAGQGPSAVRAQTLLWQALTLQHRSGPDLDAEDAATFGSMLDRAGELAAKESALAGLIERVRMGSNKPKPGRLAEDFVARDVENVEFRLSDYRGKVVVVDFWGTW